MKNKKLLLLSILIPGLGDILTGYKLRGISILFIPLVTIIEFSITKLGWLTHEQMGLLGKMAVGSFFLMGSYWILSWLSALFTLVLIWKPNLVKLSYVFNTLVVAFVTLLIITAYYYPAIIDGNTIWANT